MEKSLSTGFPFLHISYSKVFFLSDFSDGLLQAFQVSVQCGKNIAQATKKNVRCLSRFIASMSRTCLLYISSRLTNIETWNACNGPAFKVLSSIYSCSFIICFSLLDSSKICSLVFPSFSFI